MYIFGVSQPLYVDNIFTDSEKSYDNGVITPKTKMLTGIQTDRQGSLNLFKRVFLLIVTKWFDPKVYKSQLLLYKI